MHSTPLGKQAEIPRPVARDKTHLLRAVLDVEADGPQVLVEHARIHREASV
jgi:hypothetical protein